MVKVKLAICTSGEIYGGIEEFVYTLVRHLYYKKSMEFIVILFEKRDLYQKIRKLGVPIEVIDSKIKYDIYAILKIKRILEENNINVLHVHGYKASILGGLAARLSGARVVKTEHGMLEQSRGIAYLKMSINLYIDKLISKYLVNSLIFVSNDIRERWKRKYRKVPKYVIYNGINPENSIGKEVSELDKNMFNIGIVGRISEVKGHIYLISAIKKIKKLKKVRLYVFGEGPLEEEYKEYCTNNKLDEIIHFMGFKTNIHDYMNNLDLLVMPSLHEGLPYTLLEAMYLKVPVIASCVGGLKEVIKNNYDGVLVPPKDDSALAQEIQKMYKNKNMRDYLAENAHRRVCSEFLASHMVEKYIDIYNVLAQDCVKDLVAQQI